MIKVFTLKDAFEWDKTVKSFCNYDVYYLSGYVKAFELIGDGQAILIYFQNETTRAINVVMKRDLSDFPPFSKEIPKNRWFDLVTPYGYGGFLVEGTDFIALKKEYEDFAFRQNIVTEFVRFHPMLKNWKGLETLYEDIYLGNTVYMETQDENTIWNHLTSQSRNKIRKAQKAGLTVYWTRDPSIIPSFMEIYNSTMDKDSADSYYYFSKDFYESILNDLKYNAMWFYSVWNKEIVAISIFLFCNGKMHYHLSGSKYEYQKFAPTNLLLYEAALWASHHGYKTLHLGGGVGSQKDSLYIFKKAFHKGEDAEFHIGKKIFNEKEYQKLLDIRNLKNIETSFFPEYRIQLPKQI